MGRLLLVGNSRWHWARRQADGLCTWHEPGPPPVDGDACVDLEAWAAVGTLPEGLPLPAARRLGLEQIPLGDMPPWLGVDRALAGWLAWREQGHAVLVADAGTCLSLTRVDAQGRFCGGRLSAGLGLQLRSLGTATAQLPALSGPSPVAADPWPTATAEAMRQGCLQACAAAITQAWLQRDGTDPGVAEPAPWALWLTGGDALSLEPLLTQQGLQPRLEPDLCLRALATLSA
jgi:type III pantothenate kinase